MTQNTAFEDGSWHWIEYPGWSLPSNPVIAPACYSSESDAWYSHRFSGISTRFLKVLEPCRRAPAAQVPQQALALLRWAEFLLATSRPMTGQQQEAWPNLRKAADEMRILQRVAIAAAPQPPEARKPLTAERVRELVLEAGYEDFGCPDPERAAFINGLRHGEAAQGITGEPT